MSQDEGLGREYFMPNETELGPQMAEPPQEVRYGDEGNISKKWALGTCALALAVVVPVGLARSCGPLEREYAVENGTGQVTKVFELDERCFVGHEVLVTGSSAKYEASIKLPKLPKEKKERKITLLRWEETFTGHIATKDCFKASEINVVVDRRAKTAEVDMTGAEVQATVYRSRLLEKAITPNHSFAANRLEAIQNDLNILPFVEMDTVEKKENQLAAMATINAFGVAGKACGAKAWDGYLRPLIVQGVQDDVERNAKIFGGVEIKSENVTVKLPSGGDIKFVDQYEADRQRVNDAVERNKPKLKVSIPSSKDAQCAVSDDAKKDNVYNSLIKPAVNQPAPSTSPTNIPTSTMAKTVHAFVSREAGGGQDYE